MNKTNEILKSEIEKIRIGRGEAKEIKDSLNYVIKDIKAAIVREKIKAEVFIGGSYAKGTMIKKDKYDIDIFIRFDKKYKEDDIERLASRIIGKKAIRVHGSRDYFKLKDEKRKLEFEIIPCLKINKPEEARNTTDLSYSHVKYVLGKIKKHEKLEEEIMLAKAFLHFNDCYGAESYVGGFSGYATELLVIYYKSFINMLNAVVNHKTGKLIIDIEKDFRNKEEIMRELNGSKLQSPIILIDPTLKTRNAL